MIYLPDTNVFSRYLRGEDERVKLRLEANLRFCRLSSVVLSELGAILAVGSPEIL